jgi:hypothetical protein
MDKYDVQDSCRQRRQRLSASAWMFDNYLRCGPLFQRLDCSTAVFKEM